MNKKESPLIYVVAGSPASGKTSFVHKGLEENIFPKDPVIHDCDKGYVCVARVSIRFEKIWSSKGV